MYISLTSTLVMSKIVGLAGFSIFGMATTIGEGKPSSQSMSVVRRTYGTQRHYTFLIEKV